MQHHLLFKTFDFLSLKHLCRHHLSNLCPDWFFMGRAGLGKLERKLERAFRVQHIGTWHLLNHCSLTCEHTEGFGRPAKPINQPFMDGFGMFSHMMEPYKQKWGIPHLPGLYLPNISLRHLLQQTLFNPQLYMAYAFCQACSWTEWEQIAQDVTLAFTITLHPEPSSS